MLLAHPYPGNMRQLRHVLRLAGCTAEDGVITDADLDLPPGGRAAEPDFETAERNVIVEALRKHGGRVAEAARALKLSRATLYRKIRALGITPSGDYEKSLQLRCRELRSPTTRSRDFVRDVEALRRYTSGGASERRRVAHLADEDRMRLRLEFLRQTQSNAATASSARARG